MGGSEVKSDRSRQEENSVSGNIVANVKKRCAVESLMYFTSQ